MLAVMSHGALAVPASLMPSCEVGHVQRDTSQQLSLQLRTTSTTLKICYDYCDSKRRRSRTANIVPALSGILSMLMTFDSIFGRSKLPEMLTGTQLSDEYSRLLATLSALTRYCSHELISELHDISDTLISLSLVKHAQLVMNAVRSFSDSLGRLSGQL